MRLAVHDYEPEEPALAALPGKFPLPTEKRSRAILIKCMAVDGRHQGEGLLNLLVLHLTEYQMERGRTRLFVCTKTGAAPFFKDLGFYEVAQALGRAAFLENRKNGFANYIKKLQEETRRAFPEGAAKGRGETAFEAGAVVMNANPFTKGHLYLASQAASRCGILHIFVVEEERSLIPFSVRWDLVRRGTAHLENVVCHKSGPYMISQETFPSYFLKEEAAVSLAHGELDAAVFKRIAEGLGITCRFVGEEPFSQVTDLYNQALKKELRDGGLRLDVVPRMCAGRKAVSASAVRQYIHDGQLEKIRDLVPESTWEYFQSQEAQPVLAALRQAGQVQEAAGKMMGEYFASKFADRISEYAVRALLYEVAVSPKPGLVDRFNQGSHRDMDFYSFLGSAAALGPHFRNMVKIGMDTAGDTPEETFYRLQYEGINAEDSMYRAAGKANTHKGAIFSVGILCGAAGRLGALGKRLTAHAILRECASMTAKPMEEFFRSMDAGTQRTAGCAVLLHLLAEAEDTNVIARSDYDTYRETKERLKSFLKEKPIPEESWLRDMDSRFIEKNLSPGGSADLLALCWFLYFVEPVPA